MYPNAIGILYALACDVIYYFGIVISYVIVVVQSWKLM